MALSSPSSRYGSSNTPFPSLASIAAKIRRAQPTYSSPSALYGGGQPSGSPSGFYGQGAPAAAPAGPGVFSGIGSSIGAVGGLVKRSVPVIKPRDPAAAPPADPYAPKTDEQLAAEARAAISAQIDPLVAAILASTEKASRTGADAISGYTEQLARQLAGGVDTVRGIYSGAEQAQTAADQALSAQLTGQGGDLAKQLADRLAVINAPNAVGQAQGQITQDATGAGNALYARGSADLARLIAESAAGQEYASKLPGIARLTGSQQLGDFQSQVAGRQADQIGQLEAQVPGLVQGQLADLRQTELTKADRRYQQGRDAKGDATAAYNAGLISQRQLGQTLGLPGWQSLPDTRKASAAAAPKTIGNAQTGILEFDPKTGRWTPIAGTKAPAKPTDAFQPFTLSPGQTRVIPDGKGGVVKFTAPAKPANPQAPVTRNTPNGIIEWDPQTGTWRMIPGTSPSSKPAAAFTLSPGQTRVIPDGKGGYTKVTAPATPKDPEAPAHFTAGNGQEYTWDPATRTWGPVAGTEKPAEPPTIAALSVSAGTGGWNPKTNVLSPSFRQQVADFRGVDISEVPKTATREQLATAGIVPTAKTSADDTGKTSALKTANATAKSIVEKGAKKTGVYGEQPKTDVFGGTVKGPDGKPVMVRTRTGDRYSASYYETIHRIEAAVEDVLSPYMSRSEIIRFAQRYANQYYPSGKGGRPRTAAQAEAAAPTPPPFPKPKAPSRPRRPAVPNPRTQFSDAFPLPG